MPNEITPEMMNDVVERIQRRSNQAQTVYTGSVDQHTEREALRLERQREVRDRIERRERAMESAQMLNNDIASQSIHVGTGRIPMAYLSQTAYARLVTEGLVSPEDQVRTARVTSGVVHTPAHVASRDREYREEAARRRGYGDIAVVENPSIASMNSVLQNAARGAVRDGWFSDVRDVTRPSGFVVPDTYVPPGLDKYKATFIGLYNAVANDRPTVLCRDNGLKEVNNLCSVSDRGTMVPLETSYVKDEMLKVGLSHKYRWSNNVWAFVEI